MKPSQLKPGMRVLLRANQRGADMGKLLPATVASCERGNCGRKTLTVIHVDAYAGLDGPDDPGTVHLTDYQVSRLLLRMGRDGRPVEV